MLKIADATLGAIQIRARPAGLLAEGDLSRDPTGRGQKAGPRLLAPRATDVPAGQCLAEACGMNGRHFAMEKPRSIHLPQYGHDAPGTMDIFHVVLRGRGGDLAQVGNLATESVDIAHGEIHPGFMGGGQ